MGSLYTTIPDKKIKGFNGAEYSIPMYLQFVPGVVVEVVHSPESLRYNGENTLNTIIASPHITTDIGKRKVTSGEEFRYYPLLRTINDVPSKGDPVLLCTIGRVNYYLGPLNTPSNSPTWNDDPSFTPENLYLYGGSDEQLGEVSPRGIKGESPNFNKEILYSRLSKVRKKELDYGDAIKETTGDTIIEGRHGNSIRVGSRSNKPYIFISNKRAPSNIFEGIGDGSLISITSNGTLQQHFGGYKDLDTDTSVFQFQLSSDTVENNTYPIGDIQSDLNNEADIQETIYGYGGNQMLLHSDRITLNTKLDDIYLSSIKDIHIGAGRHISIGSFDTLNLLSSNVNIGNSTRAFEMQPMVLGDTLKEVLNDIVTIFSKLQVMTQLGPQNILPTTEPDIQSVTNKIESIVSSYHKIEGN